jgi:hypothetical protein
MAHFAKLDENNIVIDITVVNNDVIVDDQGNESETIGNDFLNSIGMTGTWVQCSYNASFRGMYPHPGCWFDVTGDKFLPSASPFPSWVLNESNMNWEPPVARPEDGLVYMWNENSQEWILLDPQPEV